MTNDEFIQETARLFAGRIKTFEDTHGLFIITEITMDMGDGRICTIHIKREKEI